MVYRTRRKFCSNPSQNAPKNELQSFDSSIFYLIFIEMKIKNDIFEKGSKLKYFTYMTYVHLVYNSILESTSKTSNKKSIFEVIKSY